MMAESDWDSVTVLRKRAPPASQARSKQVGHSVPSHNSVSVCLCTIRFRVTSLAFQNAPPARVAVCGSAVLAGSHYQMAGAGRLIFTVVIRVRFPQRRQEAI